MVQKLHFQDRPRYIEEERESLWYQIYAEILQFRSEALSNLGLAYEDGGMIRRSTEYLFKCIYMREEFEKVVFQKSYNSQLPSSLGTDWESAISKAKHSLGTCYLKLRMTEESEKYLAEDLLFCRQTRSRAKLNTEYGIVFFVIQWILQSMCC